MARFPQDLETFYQYLIANIQLYPTSVLRTLETLTAASDEPPAPCFLFDLSIFLFSIFQSLKFSPIKSASSLSCYFAAVSATVSSARPCSIPFWLLSAKAVLFEDPLIAPNGVWIQKEAKIDAILFSK